MPPRALFRDGQASSWYVAANGRDLYNFKRDVRDHVLATFVKLDGVRIHHTLKVSERLHEITC